ncbi:MAG: hypothetical protein HZA69_05460, partial [Gammaproteobacteria bacterium]|nr:hypothetical protein [Gammaproteobacteria bacterium]
IAGGLFAGADLASQDWNRFGQITSQATAGGLSANAQGGQFDQGFRFSFATGSAGFLYDKVVNYSATWESGGAAVSKQEPGYPLSSADNNVGLARVRFDPNSWVDRWFAEGGYVSRALNVIPGGNALAGNHDAVMARIQDWGGGSAFSIFNLPMIPVSAYMTAPALFDGPTGVTTFNCMQHGCGY